jgi:sugar/nucleoside kinase (ribokinase family)
MANPLSAVAAGHLCLDIFPNFDQIPHGQFETLLKPGRLIQVGAAQFSTGGPVSNTGLALHRLGVPTRLVAKVGADPFGKIVQDLIAQKGADLIQGVAVDPSAVTSYSVIISPKDTDRIFLHCPGANDTFTAEDISFNVVEQAALFHFGYPPIMRQMYINDGRELVEVMRRAKATGVTTSLDMAYPDPTTESGRANWPLILKSVLPFVDIFLPSFEELLFALRRDLFNQMNTQASLLDQVTPVLLQNISDELLQMGVKIVVIKLGSNGLYLRSASESIINKMGRASPVDTQSWANRDLWAPCFKVHVVGTTGSGDTTIAGFLSAILRQYTPEQAINMAVAVGACNVETPDALSGLRSWEDTLARVEAGWDRREINLALPGWQWDQNRQVWVGPLDGSLKA